MSSVFSTRQQPKPKALASLYVIDAGRPTHRELWFGGRLRYVEPIDIRAAEAGRRFFISGNKRLVLGAAAKMDAWRGRAPMVRHSELGDVVRMLVPETAWTYTSVGSPGPWQKCTVLLMDRDARPVAIAKVGLTGSTAPLLANEAVWLRQLAEVEELHGCVPEFIAFRQLSDVQVLISSVSVAGPARNIPIEKAAQFVCALQSARRRMTTFAASNMKRNIDCWLAELRPKMSCTWVRRLELAVIVLSKLFGDTELPFAAAHGDFVPWNMCIDDGRLFVYDWEFARDGYVPLYDIIHFELMASALRCRAGVARAQAVLKQSIAAAEVGGLPRCARVCEQGQLLSYIVELCLFYLSSVRGAYDRHPILDSYGSLLDQLCHGCV